MSAEQLQRGDLVEVWRDGDWHLAVVDAVIGTGVQVVMHTGGEPITVHHHDVRTLAAS